MNNIPSLRPLSPRLWAIGGALLTLLATKILAARVVTKATASGVVLTSLLSGLLYTPHNQAAREMAGTFISFMIKPEVTAKKAAPQPMVVRKKVKAPEAYVTAPAPNDSRVNLRSFLKQYTLSFSGKVICGSEPCRDAAIKVYLESKKNDPIMKTAELQPDGTYQVSFKIKETLHENVDWWIVADSPEWAARQVQGRKILMDDSTIHIEEPLQFL